jgi:hypothetical protein
MYPFMVLILSFISVCSFFMAVLLNVKLLALAIILDKIKIIGYYDLLSEAIISNLFIYKH